MTDFRRYIQVLDASGEPLDGMILVAPSEEVLDRMESDFQASIANGASSVRVNSETVAKGQIEDGIVPTSYIPTTTAPVTLTDYAATGNTITLAEAPLLGSDLSVDADLVPHTCLHGGE